MRVSEAAIPDDPAFQHWCLPKKHLSPNNGCSSVARSTAACVRRYGFGKNKRIVLFDTLVEQCSQEEVVAVLAHELGKHPQP